MSDREETRITLRVRDGQLGLLRRTVRVLHELTVEDVMENAIRAQAMLVRRGGGDAPEYGRVLTDYLLEQGRVQ
jgi:hypothetical protein